MSERPVDVAELFEEERKKKIPIAALNRLTVSYVELSEKEVDVVNQVFDGLVDSLKKVAPSMAADVEAQRSLAIKMAGVAKATFPVRKDFAFPTTAGKIGVAPLFPQGLKWDATPDDADPCYTDYMNNSWDIDLTAGVESYLLGSATAFYRTNRRTDQHTFILIFHNGVVEVGSTPVIDQFRLISEGKQDYGAYSVHPLVEIPIEPNKAIYQYPTPLGALWVDYQTGVKWSFRPRASGRHTIKLLGLIFYEHDFFATTKWV